MSSKIYKHLKYEFLHPFYWTKTMIVSIFLIQIFIGILFFCVIYIFNYKNQNQYSEWFLNERRKFILNLKLTGVDTYVWKPYLHCKTLLDPLYDSAQILSTGCLPIDFKFVAFDKDTVLNNYLFEPNNNTIVYKEKLPSSCVACHNEQKYSLLHWSIRIHPLKYNIHQLSNQFESRFKTLELISIYFGFILIFWFLYYNLKIILKYFNRLDTVIVAIQNNDLITSHFFKKIYLNRKKNIEIEINDSLMIAVLPIYKFKKWGEQYIHKINNQDITTILGCAIYSKYPLSFESIRIASSVCNKLDFNQFVLDKNIIDFFKKNKFKVDTKKYNIIKTGSKETILYPIIFL